MPRVFRSNDNVIYEGHKPVAVDAVDYVLVNGLVRITEKTATTPFADIPWQKLQNENGDYFTNELELIEYLTTVFAISNIIGGHIIT